MEWLLAGLLLVHFIFSGAESLILLRSKIRGIRLAADLVVVFSLPLAGAACIWLLEEGLGRKTQPSENPRITKKSHQIFYPEQSRSLAALPQLDYFTETNIAPADDMLLAADFEHRRRYMLDLLKGSGTDLHDLRSVRTALNNDDLETVHYAASGLQHIRRKLEEDMACLAGACKAERENTVLLRRYADSIEQYLQIVRPEPFVAQQLRHQLIRQLLRLLHCGDLSRADRLIGLLKDSGHVRYAERISQILFLNADDQEEKYLALLKYYFSTRDQAGFNLALQALRASQLMISDETLNLIRLWTGAIK